MFCTRCHETNPQDAQFCFACGAALRCADSASGKDAPVHLQAATTPTQPVHVRGEAIRWSSVWRDVGIVWALTLLGGFVVGLGGGTGMRRQLAGAASGLIFSTLAFTIVGALARANRFRQLLIVGAAAWITSIINVLLGVSTVLAWFMTILPLLLAMSVGAGLSRLLVPQRKVDVGVR